MRKFWVILVVVMIPLGAVAQMVDQVEVKEITQKYDMGLTKRPSLSFLDPSRLNLSHSYGISFFSGGGQSGSVGMYSGSLTYQLARPLTLTLGLGIAHSPGALWGDKSADNQARYFPSGRLDWRPTENFRMTIGYERVPVYQYGNGSYYRNGRYSYWRP